MLEATFSSGGSLTSRGNNSVINELNLQKIPNVKRTRIKQIKVRTANKKTKIN